MKTVVITGGQGFVGSYLKKELEQSWPEVKVLSWDRPEVDITSKDSYVENLATEQPDWLVHLAAFSAPGESFKQKDLVWRVNVEATQVLLETIEQVSPQTKIMVASSADIYGTAEIGKEGKPIPELDLEVARPKNPYAESKLAMEKMIIDKFQEKVVRVRPFPHIGPGQKEGFVTADFAMQIARIEAHKQDPQIKVGNLEARRDFTDVRDVVRAYRLLMEAGKMGEVYHVASGQGTAISEILSMLLEQTKVKITVEQDPERMRPSDVPVLVGDASKLKNETGWQPQIKLQDSLIDILNYWREEVN